MKLDRALKAKVLDVRLRDKLLAEGKITQADVDKYLKELPDDSDNMEIAGAPKAQAASPESES